MYTVQQLARLAGITPRTLRHYDAIGLLKPTRVGENGYRYYGSEALLRLQSILLYRELDMPLEDIRRVLDNPGYHPRQALEAHRSALQAQIQRLERLIAAVEQTIDHLEGNRPMSDAQLFDVFNEEQQAADEQEAMQRYDPAVVRASYRRWNRYTAAEKQRIGEEGNAVYRAFLDAMPQGPESAAAQACVEAWRSHMEYFWSPNDEQLLGIAAGYVQDPRFRANFDRIHPGLAEFVHAAVQEYMARRRAAK